MDEGPARRPLYSNTETNHTSVNANKKSFKTETEKVLNVTRKGAATNTLSNALNHRISMCCVVFGYQDEQLKVLLLNDEDAVSLPGCLANNNQTLETSARQIIGELSGAENFFLEQVYSFGNPPVGESKTIQEETDILSATAWEITVAFFALLNTVEGSANPVTSYRGAKWFSLNEIRDLNAGQKRIVEKALATLRFDIRYFPIAFELLPEKFTLTQVQSLYEAISGKKLDKRNFRKKLKALNLILPAGEKQKNSIARPSELFVFNRDIYSDSHNSIL